MITAEELAKEIARLDAEYGDREDVADSKYLAEHLLPFIQSRAAGVQGAGVAIENLARQMFDAQKDRLAADWDKQWQPTKDYWIAKATSASLATPQPPKDAGAVPDAVQELRALYKHHVNTLESARDQIIARGGECDAVDVMERRCPVLKRVRDVLESASIPQHPPAEPETTAADNDLVQVERGLLGAACAAIAKKRDAPNVLEALRKITMTPRVEPAARAQACIPPAKKWVDENGVEVTAEWMAGWDACRVEYPRAHPSPAHAGAGVEALMQSIKPATVYADGSRDWIVTAEHIREFVRRLAGGDHD